MSRGATPVAAPRPPHVLAVDDQAENLELLEEILRGEGYRVTTAADGEQALAAVAAEPPDAILLDVMMPRLDGFAVCRRLKSTRRTCFVPVVMLTALADSESRVQGLEAGADDFLTKPFQRLELLTRLRSLLRIRALRDELDSNEAVIFSMVSLLEGKDPRTRDHSRRVAALAAAVAERLAVPAPQRLGLVLGALLHDIGKIGVAEEILRQPDAERTPAARALYARHPVLGERILAPLASLRDAVGVVRHHHERLDGSGYPGGLAGAELPLAVEIVAAANAWEGLRREHPGASGPARAREMRDAAGKGRFHVAVVEAVIAAASAPHDALPEVGDLLPVPVASPGGRILVADDHATNRALYRDLLSEAGFAVVEVATGDAVPAAVAAESPDLVLLDVRMPGLHGDEVCRWLKAQPRHAFLPVILVTAYEASAARLAGLAAGADEFLSAPIHRLELLSRVRSLLRLQSYHQDLERHESVVLSLATALEAKDPYTRGHSSRVGEIASRLARQLGLPEEQVASMKPAGLLHDIGKVAVPEAVLHKAGRLTPAEHAVLMSHPKVGWEICRDLRSAASVLDCIRYHHERWDGDGYPEGLAGEAIPFVARVLAVADAFDALTSERPYRPRLDVTEALDLLRRETRNGKWDPQVFDALDQLAVHGGLALPPEIGPA